MNADFPVVRFRCGWDDGFRPPEAWRTGEWSKAGRLIPKIESCAWCVGAGVLEGELDVWTRLLGRILARRWRLPRAQTREVVCERDLRIEMDDGAVLLADRWVAEG